MASERLAAGKITAEQFEAETDKTFHNLQISSRKSALATVMIMSEATKTQLQSLGAQRQVLAAELLGVTNQMKAEAETVVTNTPTGGTRSDANAAGAGLPTMEQILKSREDRLKAEEELILRFGRRTEGLTREQALQQAQDNERRFNEKQAAALTRLKETEKAEADGRAAREKADIEFDARKAERDALNSEREKQKVADIEAGLKAYGSAAGQQLAIGKKAAKVAEDLARQAIGGQISALGDEAMAKAAIYAAALNPLAIPMAAAGVAAYAAAAALGSSAKKASSGTPASAAPAQAAPVNTSFNLRVDAAFADGESIARQFAMMQQAAQRRGLVPVGA